MKWPLRRIYEALAEFVVLLYLFENRIVGLFPVLLAKFNQFLFSLGYGHFDQEFCQKRNRQK